MAQVTAWRGVQDNRPTKPEEQDTGGHTAPPLVVLTA
jgi:hypothetical protein